MSLSSLAVETLDRPGADPALVRRTLCDIARVNAWLGGRAAVRFGLERLLAGSRRNSALSVLDVGAGSGDAIAWLQRRFTARYSRLIAVERHPVAARLCHASGIPTLQADGAWLPLRDGAVDLVIASQVLHHLERGEIPRFLRELTRVARMGVVIADLLRSGFAARGFPTLGRLLGLHPATREDGALSLQRGFTPTELGALLRATGIDARVYRRPWFRLVACWRVAGENGG